MADLWWRAALIPEEQARCDQTFKYLLIRGRRSFALIVTSALHNIRNLLFSKLQNKNQISDVYFLDLKMEAFWASIKS